MRYKREISQKIATIVKHFPALVLTGARQTGKTTLLRSMFPDYTYVSLDLPADAQLAEEDPDTFLARYPAPMIIDEIQYAPKLFRHLKVRIDQTKACKGQFLLTGSQKFSLMKEVAESLAGRCGLLELEPLSAVELGEDIRSTRRDRGLAHVLSRGFYPQLWNEPDLPREDFFRSYIATYIERDVRQILKVASLRDFNRFMRVCAVRTGQLINKSEIAKEVGISAKTANDWLSILHASNQIHLLEPYFENVGKRVVKSPKLYFTDTGLVSFLIGLNENNILGSAHIGHIWETFVFAELRRRIFLDAPEATLWFFRDQQREVDFLISYGSTIYMLDAKWKEIPSEKDFGQIAAVAGYFSRSARNVTIVSPSEKDFPVAEAKEVVSGFLLRHALGRLLGLG